jgi:hypothetical protein
MNAAAGHKMETERKGALFEKENEKKENDDSGPQHAARNLLTDTPRP